MQHRRRRINLDQGKLQAQSRCLVLAGVVQHQEAVLGVFFEIFHHLVVEVARQFGNVFFHIADPVGGAGFVQPIHLHHVLGVHRGDYQFAVAALVEAFLDPNFLEWQVRPLGLQGGVFDEAGVGGRGDHFGLGGVARRLRGRTAGQGGERGQGDEGVESSGRQGNLPS